MRKSASSEQNTKREFLEKVARMYYVLDMSQKDIADQLDVGRSSVARFLNEARKEGVVQFYITSKSDHSRRPDLERELKSTYKLKDAIVVKESNATLFEIVAVNYLNSVLPYQGSLGLGLGNTILNVSKYMHLCEERPELKVIQMTGSVGRIENEMPATSVIQNWAQALNATPHFLPAPAIVDLKEVKDVFLQDKSIQDSQNEMRDIDIAIVGIGNIHPSSAILKSKLIPELTYKELQKDSVGDILLHFYNKYGDFSMNHISERVLGAAPIDFLRIPTRIALAHGKEKSESIKGALSGRLINILFTTDETAKLLLQ